MVLLFFYSLKSIPAGRCGTHPSQIQDVAATYVVECLLTGHFPIDGHRTKLPVPVHGTQYDIYRN